FSLCCGHKKKMSHSFWVCVWVGVCVWVCVCVCVCVCVAQWCVWFRGVCVCVCVRVAPWCVWLSGVCGQYHEPISKDTLSATEKQWNIATVIKSNSPTQQRSNTHRKAHTTSTRTHTHT